MKENMEGYLYNLEVEKDTCIFKNFKSTLELK